MHGYTYYLWYMYSITVPVPVLVDPQLYYNSRHNGKKTRKDKPKSTRFSALYCTYSAAEIMQGRSMSRLRIIGWIVHDESLSSQSSQ